MHTSIFSFIQPQVNSQPQQLLPGILPQENTGTAPGIFDALITEYTLAENSDSIQHEITAQNNSVESSQPVNFSDSAKFSGIITEISQPRNETPESNPNVTENKSAWQNLFADMKRNPANIFRKHENFLPQNDFDDGVTAANSEIDDTVNIDDSDFDSHAEIHDDLPVKDNADNIPGFQQEAQKIKPEISQTEITRDNSQADIQAEKKPQDYSGNAAENLKPSAEIDKPGIKTQVPEKTESAITELPAETTEPEIKPDIMPENVRQKQNIPEYEGSGNLSYSAQNELPGITEPSRNENVTQTFRPSAEKTAQEIEMLGNIRHLLTENDTPENESSAQDAKPEITEPSQNENVTQTFTPSAEFETQESESDTPAEIPGPQNIQRKSSETPGRKTDEPEQIESRENPAAIHNDITPEKSPAKFQDIHAEIDAPSETETPGNETPAQDSNLQSESESPEIKEPLKRESPEISRENKSQEEQHEISGANIIMAGLQAVPPAQNSPEFSQAPETDNTPKNLRAPGNTRKSQPVTRETENTISFADSENPADDSRIVAPESSRTTQNQSGHEGMNDSESARPSESHGIAETPRVRITNQPERISRTTQRTESRNDTRRTEALNDFQAFFDSVNRVRRSPARVSAQPLSLRTGTYDSDGIQSRPIALRNSIVNTVRFIRSDGVRKANIIIDPPALGRISVELTSSSSGVEASVKVANEQIRQIVQDQFTQLRDNLLQQGVQVSEFTVDVRQDSGRQGNGSGSQNQRDDYTFTPSEDDDDTEIFRADLEEGLLYWIA